MLGERQASPRSAGASSHGNRDLLRIVIQAQPGTVFELAQLVGRAPPNLSRTSWQKEHEIDVDLTTGAYRLPHAA